MRIIIPMQTRRYNLELLIPGVAKDFFVTSKSVVCSAEKLASDEFVGCVVTFVKGECNP